MDEKKESFTGILSNHPVACPKVKWGDEVTFSRRHMYEARKRPKGGLAAVH